MDRVHIFKNAAFVDNQLSFTFSSSVGEVQVQALVSGEELNGNLATTLGALPLEGKKIGGHNMPNGVALPQFSELQPPTTEQLKNILGGEACMWTEWTNSDIVSSRIWPNITAVAEKLWSPKSSTQDVDDFYRRLPHIAQELIAVGIDNNTYQLTRINEIVSTEKVQALKSFVELLEEVKHYERWSSNIKHDINDPLDDIVDITLAESLQTRSFAQSVDEYLMNHNENTQTLIIENLDGWTPIYNILKVDMMSHEKLLPVEVFCLGLSDLSKIAKRLITGGELNERELNFYNEIKKEVITPRAGVFLAAATPLIKLIDTLLNEAKMES